jgi:membrane fusion protein (multidrug efflux system)
MTDEKRSKLRTLLLIVVPLVAIIVGLGFWLTSGRYESTDNAYVKSDKIMVSPEVSGTIKHRFVDNNQDVVAGAPLLVIDSQPFEIALAKATAELGTTRANIENMKSMYLQKKEQMDMASSDMALADAQFERASTLSKTGAESKSQLDEATRNRDSAHAQMALLQRESEGIVAQLDGNPDIAPEDHSSYKAALAAVTKAKLDLEHTKINAPAAGIVGNMPNVGDYARVSVPALSLVETRRVWVEANYKETQLEHIKPGQKVEVDIDSFPSHKFHGTVDSISAATGSEFSILPAQNATGNWVKVVQRLAVRIRIDDSDAAEMLRPGMSAETKIDLKS